MKSSKAQNSSKWQGNEIGGLWNLSRCIHAKSLTIPKSTAHGSCFCFVLLLHAYFREFRTIVHICLTFHNVQHNTQPVAKEVDIVEMNSIHKIESVQEEPPN